MAKARTVKKTTGKGKSDSKAPAKSATKSAPAASKSASASPKPKSVETKAVSAELAAQGGIPSASQARSHPDAKLTKSEVSGLYAKLVEERNRVVNGFDRHVAEALEDGDVLADEIDIAQRSTDQAWLFRFADKERKLLIEIDAALDKLRTGEYGICEGTDEPIGYKRLELRPWTRYSVAYKEMLEREKAQQAR